jgi:hypothetical protein
MNSNDDKTEKPDKLSLALISGWLILFGVRSLIVTPLMWNATLSMEQVVNLDSVLLRVYLILFALTCLVAALRVVRSAEQRSKSSPVPESEN